ncbi:MAG: hypothetical protein EXX96DRAFT_458098, partial [Benjaminiella poitrasii]
DYGLKTVYKDFEHHLVHGEIIKDNNAHHSDFLKLCNIFKNEIDLLSMEEIAVFGILIGG